MKTYEITLEALDQYNNPSRICFDVMAENKEHAIELALETEKYIGNMENWAKRKHDIKVFMVRELTK